LNVLITSAGRRNYLVEYFLHALGDAGLVIAADSSPNAPGLYAAQKRIVIPPANHSDYIPSLLEICRGSEVSLLIPLNDLELGPLAANREKFTEQGTVVVVSDSEVVEICSDKLKTFRWLRDNGFASPSTFVRLEDASKAIDEGALKFPLVVKPRWGSGSIAVCEVHDSRELHCSHFMTGRSITRSILAEMSSDDTEDRTVLIQEQISGQEYGLDVINDLSGNYQATVVKRKLGMRGGETDRAEVVLDKALEELGAAIGRTLKHIGNLDVDVISDKGGTFSVIEMNPRFGGGYPFSHSAGADLPSAILDWRRGSMPPKDIFAVVPGVFGKFDSLLFLREENPRDQKSRTRAV